MNRTFESADCATVRRNPWILALCLSPLLAKIAYDVGHGTALWQIVLWAALMAPGSLLVLRAANPRPLVKPVRVRADAQGVTIGDRFLPRGALLRGLAAPDAPETVWLHRRGLRLPVQLRMASAGDATALLQALGLDVAQTVVTFRTSPGLLIDGRLVLVPIALLLGQMVLMTLFDTGLSDWPVFLLLLAVAQLILWPTWVGVGADGIALGWLWRRRFVGFDAITSVTRLEKGRKAQAGLRVVQASGEELVLTFQDEGTLAQIEERIRDAMDAFRERGAAGSGGPFRRATGPVGTALLRRGERGPGEWVAALRALGAGGESAGGMVTVPRERLFRIVEDPAAEAVDRVAAVVALGGEIDAEGRQRLRAAAELVAAPRLRVALEMAAEGESEAEGEAALAEVGGEERGRRVS